MGGETANNRILMRMASLRMGMDIKTNFKASVKPNRKFLYDTRATIS